MMGTSLVDLMASTVVFVTTPCSLAQILFVVAVRALVLATLAWMHLLKSLLQFHVDLCCDVLAWALALVTLPFRVLTAPQRERALENQLHEMQLHLESLVWENKELEERLQIAIGDRKILETVFEEIEEEYEQALDRVTLLEDQLRDVKEENQRLNEVKENALSIFRACGDQDDSTNDATPSGANYCVPSWNSSYTTRGLVLQLHGDACIKDEMGKNVYPFPARVASRHSTVDEALEQRRIVALRRSLFSAMLSLLVGLIIWEAEDPCMPLVAALFTVVAMSLGSVVQFFSTIRNKPASDAVALLSMNWFILGTLTSPALPSVARILSPCAIRLANRAFRWSGLASQS